MEKTTEENSKERKGDGKPPFIKPQGTEKETEEKEKAQAHANHAVLKVLSLALAASCTTLVPRLHPEIPGFMLAHIHPSFRVSNPLSFHSHFSSPHTPHSGKY